MASTADQGPLGVDLLQTPQQELPEAPTRLDLAEDRLHRFHPQSVAFPTGAVDIPRARLAGCRPRLVRNFRRIRSLGER